MSKEIYLQLKKEFRMRFAFNLGIAGIGLVLLIVMIFNKSRYIPYLLVVMGMISLMNQVLVMPTKAKKDACEKEHPEWKEVSVKGVKVDSQEQSKRYGVSLIALIVVIGSFFAMYRPTLQAQKEQVEKVEIQQKLQLAVENIQKQEQSSREAVQSQMKDLLRTPSSSSEIEATSGE
ncbi:hypothetical protein [Streptococcus parasanguinis]|uniref:hypothetical protein n=1 Tax=Streptococcus parasanguinis TaxID=1318 RepID=UPI0034A2F297